MAQSDADRAKKYRQSKKDPASSALLDTLATLVRDLHTIASSLHSTAVTLRDGISASRDVTKAIAALEIRPAAGRAPEEIYSRLSLPENTKKDSESQEFQDLQAKIASAVESGMSTLEALRFVASQTDTTAVTTPSRHTPVPSQNGSIIHRSPPRLPDYLSPDDLEQRRQSQLRAAAEFELSEQTRKKAAE